MIVTFKPKDKRPDGEKDKLEILSDAITSEVNFLSAGEIQGGAAIGMAPETMGYDVDEYEAPIVTLSLSDDEIKALEKNPNVAVVEDDGEMYALETVAAPPPVQLPGPALAVEDQPSPLAETIPTGVNQIKAPLAWGLLTRNGHHGRDPRHRDRRHPPGPLIELPRWHQLRCG